MCCKSMQAFTYHKCQQTMQKFLNSRTCNQPISSYVYYKTVLCIYREHQVRQIHSYLLVDLPRQREAVVAEQC